MKGLLSIVAVAASLFWIIGLAILVSTDLQILEPEEQQRLKDGKLFWDWSSPYGTLRVHYVEQGQGNKHLILLHGFRAHTYTWHYLMNPLAEAGYHVWAIDFIGYGLSDKPDYISYHLTDFTAQVEAFMTAKGISKAHLVGNSMGGGVALHFALSHPDRTLSITLLNALGYPLDMPLYLSISRYFQQIWVPFLGPTVVRHCLEQIVHSKELVSDEQVEAYSLPYRFPGGITATLLTLQQFDNQLFNQMSQCYSTLPHPVLVIWGHCDTLLPFDHYKKFLQDFSSGSCLLIPYCGHLPQEESPQQVLKAMFTFLEEYTPSRE
jgi:pimeloyl-ACP methyl ester carboxylesterase